MRTLLIATAAVAALTTAGPATAQSQYPYQPNPYARGAVGIDNRIARLEARIEAGVRAGTIDRREARRLRGELRQLARLDMRYGRDGLSREERADLQQRLRVLRQHVRVADRGTYDRFEQRGEWADYDDGYGRGYYGRGGPDEALDRWCTGQVSARGGIGALFENLLGMGGLRVGQRAGGNLYAVPSEHRDLFRDGYGLYYRSDGRAVYEIDANTHVVTRVCAMPD